MPNQRNTPKHDTSIELSPAHFALLVTLPVIVVAIALLIFGGAL